MLADESKPGSHEGPGYESLPAARSPLSTLPPQKIRDLPRTFLLEQFESYYGVKPPPEIVECDYSLWRCAETGLEFAWPMLPGNIAFYEWLSQFDSYYPGERWEYGEVRRLIESTHAADQSTVKVIDVGCGKGDFLRGLGSLSPKQKFALDLNEPAVEVCRQQGFQAFCGTMETAQKAGFVGKRQFPVVTSFHCLEHVDNPLEFVRSVADITMSGGRIYLSTPYSPMSFESEWFDVLNHPPHHMTRWNLKAYQRLASLLSLKLRWFSPRSSAVKRTLGVFRLKQYGPNRSVGKGKLVCDLVRRLPTVWRLFQAQKMRSEQNGGIDADSILVELTIP
jgi:2-polyprenyl-3-methyl-5-hydroxy-6-metoxy-1,4-benzoquinol methylase